MALDPNLTTLVGLSGNVTPEVAGLVLAQGAPRKVRRILDVLGQRLGATGAASSPTMARLAGLIAGGAHGHLPPLLSRASFALKVDGVTLARELEAAALRSIEAEDAPARAAASAALDAERMSAEAKAAARQADADALAAAAESAQAPATDGTKDATEMDESSPVVAPPTPTIAPPPPVVPPAVPAPTRSRTRGIPAPTSTG